MGTKGVELEVVNYKTDEIANTAATFIYLYAKYSGIFGTEQWIDSISRLIDTIHNQKPMQHLLSADGVDIAFSGFPLPIAQVREEGVIFASREPRFVVTDRMGDLLPSARTNILRVNDEITREMSEVYRLKVVKDPTTLIFPKEEYAKEGERVIFNAALIT